MRELYTKATLRKCGKIKALEKLECIYKNLNEDDKAKYIEDFADLFSFFTPKPSGKKVKNPTEWVNLAVSKDLDRYYLRASYSDGEWLVATDGHRLHRIKTSLEKGYRDVSGNVIDLNGTFPDYTKLFFDEKNKLNVTLDLEKAELEKFGKKWVYIFNVEGVKYGINKRYFDDAVNGNTVLKGHFNINIKPEEGEPEAKTKQRVRSQIGESRFQSEDKTILLTPINLT